MKLVVKQKVQSVWKEADILREKMALFKLRDEVSKQSERLKTPVIPWFVKLVATFNDEVNLYLIMENLQGLKSGSLDYEVWEDCWTFGSPSHKVAKYTFYQICLAVQQLHSLKIAHRDLKPENMFFSHNRSFIKLIDFGSCLMIGEPEIYIDDDPKRRQHLNFVGTPQYMAPECAHNKPTGLYSDIWSLGAILY